LFDVHSILDHFLLLLVVHPNVPLFLLHDYHDHRPVDGRLESSK
jgi:hypothetical protein